MMKFDEDLIVLLILLFSWVEYLWELYLSLRQVMYLVIYSDDVYLILSIDLVNKVQFEH